MGFKMKGSAFYGKAGAFKKASGFKETDPKKPSTSATSNLLDRLADYEGQVQERKLETILLHIQAEILLQMITW